MESKKFEAGVDAYIKEAGLSDKMAAPFKELVLELTKRAELPSGLLGGLIGGAGGAGLGGGVLPWLLGADPSLGRRLAAAGLGGGLGALGGVGAERGLRTHKLDKALGKALERLQWEDSAGRDRRQGITEAEFVNKLMDAIMGKFYPDQSREEVWKNWGN